SFGHVCAPKPPEPFKSRLCILNASGNVPCPEGKYSDKVVFSSVVKDTRSCSECKCSDPQGVCSATWSIWERGTHSRCQGGFDKDAGDDGWEEDAGDDRSDGGDVGGGGMLI